ncbi:uncharacterized protein DEA37_0009488 [Paragonimus westermani]|uniref:Uncharacterized protein n=1 Tax=Paragonimus westermani TaxID=34504 RepID=A0A5J4NBJ6_9TREM|nr:uncharacterized protein DEA37_0009488 [Paragonimus westermani]
MDNPVVAHPTTCTQQNCTRYTLRELYLMERTGLAAPLDTPDGWFGKKPTKITYLLIGTFLLVDATTLILVSVLCYVLLTRKSMEPIGTPIHVPLWNRKPRGRSGE